MRLALLSFISLTGCTGGFVLDDPQQTYGSAGQVVEFSSCAGRWVATTDSNGLFTLNPFDPNSSSIDTSKEVPTGSIDVKIGDALFTVNSDYANTCTLPWNGSSHDLPCNEFAFSRQAWSPGSPTTWNGLPIIYPFAKSCPGPSATVSESDCYWQNLAFSFQLQQRVQKCIIQNLR